VTLDDLAARDCPVCGGLGLYCEECGPPECEPCDNSEHDKAKCPTCAQVRAKLIEWGEQRFRAGVQDALDRFFTLHLEQARQDERRTFEAAKLAAYRQARIFEPNMDTYDAAMAVYAAAFGRPDGEPEIVMADGSTKQPWELRQPAAQDVVQTPTEPVCHQCKGTGTIGESGLSENLICRKRTCPTCKGSGEPIEPRQE